MLRFGSDLDGLIEKKPRPRTARLRFFGSYRNHGSSPTAIQSGYREFLAPASASCENAFLGTIVSCPPTHQGPLTPEKEANAMHQRHQRLHDAIRVTADSAEEKNGFLPVVISTNGRNLFRTPASRFLIPFEMTTSFRSVDRSAPGSGFELSHARRCLRTCGIRCKRRGNITHEGGHTIIGTRSYCAAETLNSV